MRICSIGTTDRNDIGTAAELRKWEGYYRSVGYEIIRCRGEWKTPPRTAERRIILPQIAPDQPTNNLIIRHIFGREQTLSRGELLKIITELADTLYQEICDFSRTTGATAFHVDSLLTNPLCLPFTLALRRASEELNLKVVSRDHDLNFNVNDPFTLLVGAPDGAFPPSGDWVRHVLLTRWAARSFEQYLPGVEYQVIPNLFNFDIDRQTHNPMALRRQWGVGDKDILFVQPTRCIPYKGIHRAIQLAAEVRRLTGRRTVVMVTGDLMARISGIDIGRYRDVLETLADSLNVQLRMLGGKLPDCSQSTGGPSHRRLCVMDAYLAADLITFMTDIDEGFGNPTIESVATCRPLVSSDYPVMVNEFMTRGLEFPVISYHSMADSKGWLTNPASWLSEIEAERLTRGLTTDLASALMKTLDNDASEVDRLKRNHALGTQIYADTKKNISRYLESLLGWLETSDS